MIGRNTVAKLLFRRVVEGGDERFLQRRGLGIGRLPEHCGHLVQALDRADVPGVERVVFGVTALPLGEVDVVAVAQIGGPLDHAPLVQMIEQPVRFSVLLAVEVEDVGECGVPFAGELEIPGEAAVLHQQQEHDERIFGDLLHEGAGRAGHQAAVDERGAEKVVEELLHRREIFCQDGPGEQAVAGVAEVVTLLPLHAVLNDLLHAVVEGVDTELPHRQ